MRTPKLAFDGTREACNLRAAVAADGRSTASLRTVSKTVHNDAVESTARRRSGSRIARLAHSTRTPKLAFA
eukprot:1887860-Lingulodinium_polyedra.AAC.1